MTEFLEIGKVIVRIVLGVLYVCLIFFFAKDLQGVREAPHQYIAIQEGVAVRNYILMDISFIAYFIVGIILLFLRIKRNLLWILLYASPLLFLIISSVISDWFNSEY